MRLFLRSHQFSFIDGEGVILQPDGAPPFVVPAVLVGPDEIETSDPPQPGTVFLMLKDCVVRSQHTGEALALTTVNLSASKTGDSTELSVDFHAVSAISFVDPAPDRTSARAMHVEVAAPGFTVGGVLDAAGSFSTLLPIGRHLASVGKPPLAAAFVDVVGDQEMLSLTLKRGSYPDEDFVRRALAGEQCPVPPPSEKPTSPID